MGETKTTFIESINKPCCIHAFGSVHLNGTYGVQRTNGLFRSHDNHSQYMLMMVKDTRRQLLKTKMVGFYGGDDEQDG